jgi:hypothetical protein
MRRTVLLALLLASAGCSMLPGPGTRAASQAVVEAPADELWPRLVGVYRQLGLPVTEATTEEYRIWGSSLESVWSLLLPGDDTAYLRCSLPGRPSTLAVIGGAGARTPRVHPLPQAMPNQLVSVNVSTVLRPQGAVTRIETRLSATGAAVGTGEPRQEVYCVSTGRLEERIHTALLQAQSDL